MAQMDFFVAELSYLRKHLIEVGNFTKAVDVSSDDWGGGAPDLTSVHKDRADERVEEFV